MVTGSSDGVLPALVAAAAAFSYLVCAIGRPAAVVDDDQVADVDPEAAGST
jgi:hypothetical protein